ncbi:MAG: ribose-phosphate diphosphokinase [Thermoplasmata archaeon]|nr:ribose-phosphate diphosphokinase [Thermoplasmata archaeon]
MIVVGGTCSQKLSNALVECSGWKMAGLEIRRFPDRECYVKINDNLDGEDVVLVQSSYPDDNIIELFLLQDAISRFDTNSLTTIVPYFGYARQDKSFKEGEAVSARNMAKHIGLISDKIYTIDIHNISMMDAFGKPGSNLSGMRQIGKYLAAEGVDVVLSPDAGSKFRASVAAEAAGCGWDFLEKTRIDDSTVEIKPKNLDVEGKCVAIVDDIIATGGTIIKAAEQLRIHGAKRIIAACTHGLYTGDAIPKLEEACDVLISTDTLETNTSKISMASVINESLI